MDKVTIVVFAVGGFVAICLLLALVVAWPVQLLWNDVAVDLFRLPHITFWQALELSFLCSLLFKSSNSKSE